jgi:chorismate mutase
MEEMETTNDNFTWIAGPCSAESEEQVVNTARDLVAHLPISYYRAGLWKPRTSPNSFEGMGAQALPWMKKAKEETGVKIITEVATSQHVELCLENNFDALWIGARTTTNPFSVQEIAEALRGVNIPIFIKNPINPDLSLWIGAFERFQKVGLTDLSAIHRGFSVANKQPYRNKPLWEIPIEFKTQFPEIPLICDPSHICGNRTLLKDVSQRAIDLGMNGIMIESHPNPDQALSDAAQQITPAQVGEMASALHYRTTSLNSSSAEKLQILRDRVDALDADIIDLLGKRMNIAREMGALKKEEGITIFQLERWKEILESREQWGKAAHLTETFLSSYLEAIHKESIRAQNGVMNKD